jgi:hypothetical protein
MFQINAAVTNYNLIADFIGKKPFPGGTANGRRQQIQVHKWGPKEGRELTDYESGIRSGYLQCQTDHAELWKFKNAKEAEKAEKAAKKTK